MRIDRLLGILTILLQQEKTTTLQLAEHFEVSRRTILRDIDALNLAGIPIVSTQGKNGGVAIMAGYKINKSVLTDYELENLLAVLKSLDSLSGQKVSKNLLTKLAPERAIIDPLQSMIIDFSGNHKDTIPEKINLLKQAIAKQRSVSFDYYYAKGKNKRTIDPYCIEFRWQAWYIFGYCHKRKDFRRFKLNRLWQLTITDDSFTFQDITERYKEADEYPIERYRLTILFDKSVRFRLIEEYGLNSYQETDDGLLLSLDYLDKAYIFSWILGFGDKAQIINPQPQRAEFKDLVDSIQKRYQDN